MNVISGWRDEEELKKYIVGKRGECSNEESRIFLRDKKKVAQKMVQFENLNTQYVDISILH